MKQITLNIPDNKFQFFLEFIKHLSFIKVADQPRYTKEQLQLIKDIKEGLKDVDLHLKGKKKLKSAEQLLNEL